MTKAWVDHIRDRLVELPQEKRRRFDQQYGIEQSSADLLTHTRMLSDFFERTVDQVGDPLIVAKWMQNELLGSLRARSLEIEQVLVTPESFARLLRTIQEGTLSRRLGKLVLEEMVETGREPETIVDERGWSVVSDDATLMEWIAEVLAEHPDAVVAYHAGRQKLFQFFVGQVMKRSRGQADPARLRSLLEQALGR